MALGENYLLLGPERGKKEDFLRSLSKGQENCVVKKYFASDDDCWPSFFADIGNPDLFISAKTVILECAESIKSSVVKTLVSCLKAPLASVTVVLLSDEHYINKDIMDCFDNNHLVKFYEMYEKDKPGWIRNYFAVNEMRISESAIFAILERVNNNSQEFKLVCDALISYVSAFKNKDSVSYEDVDDFISHSREEDEFTLFAHIARCRLESALECFATLMLTKDSSVCSSMCSRLAIYFRRALSVKKNMQNGMGSDEAFKTPYYSGERAIVTPKDRDIYKACLANYNEKDLERCLALLAGYDIKIKSSGTFTESLVCEQCIMNLIVRKGRVVPEIKF